MTDTSSTNGSTAIQLDITVQRKATTGEALDAIVASAKLTKADAGRAGYNSEEWVTLAVEGDPGNPELPKITINTHSKLTKADAG